MITKVKKLKIDNINKVSFIFLVVVTFVCTLFPATSLAAESIFIVCDGVNTECDLRYLVRLVSKVLEYLVIISIPIAAGVFAYAGFLYMTTGVADRKSEAKSMLTKVFIGFVLMLSAWLIVNTIAGAIFESSITGIIDQK